MSKSPSVNVMDCRKTRRWVQRRLDGEELSPEGLGLLESHLGTCKRCRVWASQLEAATARLRELSEPRPSWGFEARLMRALGLASLPVWLRWVAGIAVSLSGAWLVAAFLAGERLYPLFPQGIPWLSRLWHFATKLSGLGIPLTGFIDVAVGCIAATLLLIVLGLIASKMLSRSRTLVARSF